MEERGGCLSRLMGCGCSVAGMLMSLVFMVLMGGLSVYLQSRSMPPAAPVANPPPRPAPSAPAPAPARRRER